MKCDNNNYRIFRRLSCIAQQYFIVIVENMGDKLPRSATNEAAKQMASISSIPIYVVFEENIDFIAK